MIYKVGDTVLVKHNSFYDSQYIKVTRKECKCDEIGIIKRIYHGHGICYEVQHNDNTIAYYEPEEIFRINI